MPATPTKLLRPVVLVGMMGAGKTAVGTALARMLGVAFRDSDDALVKAADRSISEIFERDGEEFFRARETEVICRLLSSSPCILSTGGGAFLSEINRKIIAEKAISVWLKADLDLLWNRVKHKNTRPLLQTSDPFATLKGLVENRDPVYAKATLSVQADPSYSIEDMAAKVHSALIHHGRVLETTS